MALVQLLVRMQGYANGYGPSLSGVAVYRCILHEGAGYLQTALCRVAWTSVGLAAPRLPCTGVSLATFRQTLLRGTIEAQCVYSCTMDNDWPSV